MGWTERICCTFEKIKELFPEENIDHYFIKNSGKQSYTTGLLFSHYKYRHELLKKELKISKNEKQLKPPRNSSNIESNTDKIQIETLRKELIGKHEPWEDIVSGWKKTCSERMLEMCDRDLAKILNRWPKYKALRGYELVNTSFIFSFPLWKKSFSVRICKTLSDVFVKNFDSS